MTAEPICCGNPMARTDDDTTVYECMFRGHHPRYITPALFELIAEAHRAGAVGGSLREFLEVRDLHTELDADSRVVQSR
ncbi:hypothetical protein [Nocardia carnea]|uniref:hypothetical protein n=1 Tax=Nocardia carnea TaxID=37328 RepID=UPI002453AED1|nr:hypothetical protein [Nocardia carnea]